MSTETAEVRVRLVASQDGDAVINRMRDGIKDISAATDRLNQMSQKASASEGENAKKKGMSAWVMAKGQIAGQFMAARLEQAYQKALSSAKELYDFLAKEAPAAAAEEEKSIKNLAGIFTTISNGVQSYAQLHEAASIYHDELESAGIAAGVSGDEMRSAFDQIAQRSDKSVEDIQSVTNSMSIAARVIPGGMNALGNGFSMLEMGLVKAKNPLVQLIAQTETLKGSAKDVAKQMQKMAPKEMMELAEKAIGKMADKVKDVPLTFDQIQQSTKDIKQNFVESLGGPILSNVIPIMERWRMTLLNNADAITEVAKHVGTRVGDVIRMADEIKNTFIKVFTGEGQTLGDTIKNAADYIKEKFEWIYEHKDELAKTFKDMADAVKSSFGWVADKLRAAADFLKRTEMGDGYVDKDNAISHAKDVNDLIKKSPGMSQGDFDQNKANFKGLGQKAVASGGMTQAEVDDYMKGFETLRANTVSQFEQMHSEFAAAAAGGEADASRFITAYNKAYKAHDENGLKYAMKILASSENLQLAMSMSGDMIEGGILDLADRAKKAGVSMATTNEWIDNRKKVLTAGAGGSVVMNGGQTFNIKQDFRDQDPDRVAIVFRDDIMRSAFSRVSAKTATPLAW